MRNINQFFPAQDLLKRLLEKDPTKRPSLEDCLDHEFFIESNRRMSAMSFSFARYTLTPQYNFWKSIRINNLIEIQGIDQRMQKQVMSILMKHSVSIMEMQI